ncbi:hypothetical protein AZE42_08464 [Rhizopogon vesiculosus]|uniref:Uncharacterized protein n=1 Tax=Rhizopogon vesiculosus TaxID=180088 RepID=A0A1J8QZ34_9AGAM|nr:hypothetical protein AZE42_08464 [Rhizopogon vesiculosus]
MPEVAQSISQSSPMDVGW